MSGLAIWIRERSVIVFMKCYVAYMPRSITQNKLLQIEQGARGAFDKISLSMYARWHICHLAQRYEKHFYAVASPGKRKVHVDESLRMG